MSQILKINTIKDRGLGDIIKAQALMNRHPIRIEGFEMYSYQYQGAALDTVAWFMYGVKPVKYKAL